MEQRTNHFANLLVGSKPFYRVAQEVFPILVRQAKAGSPISYSHLAEEVGLANPRNLGKSLGVIGRALQEISEQWGERIPPINCLVLNKNTRLPGEGIGWFLSNKEAFKNSPKQIQKQIVDGQLADIYVYQKWDDIFQVLELKPKNADFARLFERVNQRYGFGAGESDEHKDFKNWVFNNPSVLKLEKSIKPIKTEYRLYSQDEIDVVFGSKNQVVGVEVKSKISDESDIQRGLFQCIKYLALIEAEQKVKQSNIGCRVILALEGQFPKSLIPVRNILGIDVMDNLR